MFISSVARRIKEEGKVRVISNGEMLERTDLKGVITHRREHVSRLCGKGMYHRSSAKLVPTISMPCRDWTLKLKVNISFGFLFLMTESVSKILPPRLRGRVKAK